MTHYILRLVAYLNTQKNHWKHKRGLRRGQYRMFFINHLHKSVYIENPKAASRSILKMFGTAHLSGLHHIACSVPHPRIALVLPCYKSWIPHLFVFSKWRRSHETRDWLTERELREYYLFTFVRNPFDRLVSGYTNKIISNAPIQPPSQSGARTWREFLELDEHADMHDPEAFKRFVQRYIMTHNDQQLNVHFKPQHVLVAGGITQSLDYIGHIERLDEDWETLAARGHVPKSTAAHLNPSTYRNPYETYFGDKEVIDLVYQRYQQDIETFDYRAEHHALRQTYEN